MFVVLCSALAAQVLLTPTASPSVGQAGVTDVTVTGSSVPAGTISPANVTVTLQPATPGTGPTVTTPATSVTTLVGTTRRFVFRIPPSLVVTAPIPYRVSIAGTVTGGSAFTSTNAALLTVNPPASLASIAPATGRQGQTIPVTISGNFSNFTSGVTTVNAGAGITVTGVTVASRTSLTAQFAIAAGAVVGPRTITVTTATEALTLVNGFQVTANVVSLTSVTPNSGQQGQTLNVALVGLNTNWGPGTTATFGDGVTVNSLNVTSATTATANITITPRANVGVRSVTVAIGGELATLTNGFTVTPGPAAITSVTPDQGTQGQTLTVDIVGSQTNFLTAATTVSFGGSGVTVGSVQVLSPTLARVNLTIAGNASTGLRSVSVTTGGETATRGNAFTVVAGTATILSALPTSGQQGQTLNVVLTGQFTNWTSGGPTPTNANFGAGITVNSLTVASATSATANITISPLANVGGRTVTLTTGSEVVTSFFSVTAGNAALLSVNPPNAKQGETLSLTLTGSGTNWAAGQTSVSFGVTGGITVNGVAVTNATSLLVNITIAAGATVGARPVTVTTAGETVTLNNGFTVDPGVPAITLNPTSGQQGQTLNVAVTGTFTTFRAGLTTASFGTGVTVNSVTVANATSATVNITISPTATTGSRSVSLTTNGQTVSTNFTVTSSGASILSLVPNAGAQGSGPFNVIVTGSGTNFGATSVPSFGGAGITIHSTTVNSATQLTMSVSVAPAAPVGLRNFTVTTGGETATKIDAFNVVSAAISPNTGQQGQTLNVSFIGTLTNWVNGVTTVNFGAGITVNSVTVTTPLNMTANITIQNSAVVGARNVTITTGTEVAILANAFNVTNGSPTLTSALSPAQGQQGATLTVNFSGQFTNWVQGTTTVNFGAGITVNTVTVGNATTMAANITISPTATLGFRTVVVTTGTEVITATNGFTVIAGTALVSAVTPNSGEQGQNVNVTITGQNTNFQQGTTVASFGAGITVQSLTVASATSATATLAIDAAAAIGLRTVTMTTGGQVATLANGFNVLAATPVISSVTPNTGQQGQTLNVTVLGQFTSFAQGVTTVSFGTGITVNTVTVNNATSLTANITISPTSVTGARAVTATTGTEIATLANAFFITAGTASISAITPNSATQGDSNVALTVTGLNTNFQNGVTTGYFSGTGITVVSVNVSSATSAVVTVSLNALATPGLRTLTLTTGGQNASIVNGFTVIAGTPVISIVSPNTGTQGQTLNVQLVGTFTNFVNGTSVADFGSGITVNSTTVTSPTQATANITISPIASLGARGVAVNTGSENASVNSGFTVQAGTFTLSSVTPNSARQNQTVTVTIVGTNTNFANGLTVASFGASIQVGVVSVTSPTQATVQVSVDPAAAVGPRNVTVTTGGQTATLASGFTVEPGLPALTNVNPSTGRQGDVLAILVTGQYTNFVQGQTTANFGAGVNVQSVAVNSATSATVNVTIDENATLGTRAVTMTTGAQTATLNPGFTVLGGLPAITSITPGSSQAGTAPVVTIQGRFTNWVQGVTTVSFGGNITVGGVTVTGARELTVPITIGDFASLGNRTVTVTTGTEVVTTLFNVLAGTPQITSITPNVGRQGFAVNVTVQGRFLNWTSATTASFGAGVSVGGAAEGASGPVTVSGCCQFTATLNINAAAALGPRDVVVTTGTAIDTVAAGFTVTNVDTTPPQVLRTSPTSNATNVPINTAITVEFNEPMDRNTIIPANVLVYDYTLGNYISLTGATFTLDAAGRVATFNLNRLFAAGRQYQFYISTALRDTSNNPLQTFWFNFTTSLSTEQTGPAITTFSPRAGATAVPLNTRVHIRFDKPINPLTQVNGLNVQAGGVNVPGTWTYESGNVVAVFTPTSNLAASTVYTVNYTQQLTDTAGNPLTNPGSHTFTTGTATDTTGPTVVATSPFANATGVGRNIRPTVFFSEPINPVYLSTSNFILVLNATGQNIAATVAVAADRLSATLTPAALLSPDTYYYFQVTSPRDLVGTIGSGTTIYFTTGSGADTTAPTVTSVNPPNTATGVPVNVRPTIYFSEPVQSAGLPVTAFQVLQGGSPVAGTWTLASGGGSATFTPTANLAVSTVYTIQASGFPDFSGNVLAAFNSTFTTGASATADTTGPTRLTTSPANSATGVAVDTTVVVTFNEPIDPATVSASSMPMFVGPANVVASGTYAVTGAVVTFTPTSPFPANTNVLVRVGHTSYPRDLAGNQAQFSQTTFTTANTVDTSALQVLSVSPANNATGVGRNVTVVLTFNKSLDPSTASTSANTFALFAGFTRLSTTVTLSADNRTVFLTAGLPADAIITVVATSGVTDLSGNSLADYRSEFRTLPDVPTTRPSIVTQRPGNGSSGVAQNTQITLYANAALNPATLNGNVTVTQTGVPVAGTVSLTSGGFGIRFVPQSALPAGTLIQVFVGTGVQDTFGNSMNSFTGSFTTAPDPAVSAPTLVRVSPPIASTGQPVTSMVELEFSEALDPSTITSGNVQLRGPNNNSTPILATISLRNGRVIRIDPSANLQPGAYYYWFVGTGVRDLQGTALASNQNNYFYAGDASTADSNGPTVLSVAPPDGSTNVGVNALIRATFSEPVNPLTVDGTTVLVTGGGTTVVPTSISFGANNTEITITPMSALPENTVMTIQISGVEDVSGNAVTPRTTQFTTAGTADVTAPDVERFSVAQSAVVPVNSVFTIDFTEPIDTRTFVTNNTSVAYLYDFTTNTYLPITASFSSDLRSVTIVPTTALPVGRQFQLYAGNYRDLAGNSASGTWVQFFSAFETDSTPPQVSLINPPDGSTNAPINSQLQVVFNEPLQATSINSINLIVGGVPQTLTRSIGNGNRTVSLFPLRPLQASTAHTISITEVRDTSGNILPGTVTRTFTTGPGADLFPGAVVSRNPVANQTNVARNVQPTLVLNKRVNPASVTPSNFRLIENNSGRLIPTSISISPDLQTLTLTPLEQLAPNTYYYYQASGWTDLAGNAFTSLGTSYFTTGTTADSGAPTVTGVTPPNGATGVPVNTQVNVLFSEPLGAAQPTVSNVSVLLNGTTPVAGIVTINSSRNYVTFAPLAPLAVSSNYTVSVSGLRDVAGNLMTAFNSSFTTGASATPDTAAPVRTNTSPVNAAAGVPVNTTVTLTFDKPINPATVSVNSIPLFVGPGSVIAAGTYSVNGNVVTFTPLQPFPASTNVLVRVGHNSYPQSYTGVNAQFSQTSFTTASTADTTGPTVLSVSPANNATSVGRYQSIVLTFSESLNPTTANNAVNYGVFAGATRLNPSISLSADNTTVSLWFGELDANTLHTVFVYGGITDLSGNPVTPFNSSFTTTLATDVTVPRVVSQRPASGATGVSRTTPITLYLSEPMNTATIPGALRVSQSGVLVPGSTAISGNGQVVTFTPSAPLAFGALIQVFLDPSAVDTTGNPLTSYSGTFTVAADPLASSATVVRTSPPMTINDAPLNTVFEIEYSRDLNPSTVNTTNVQLRGPNNNSTPVGITVSLRNNRVIRIVPNSPLNGPNVYYYAFVGTGVKDAQGGDVTQFNNYVYTSGTTDTVSPTVQYLVPPGGTTGVGVNALMRVGFSERINQLSVNANSVSVTAGGSPVAVNYSFNSAGTELTLTPLSTLPPNATVQVEVNGALSPTGVQDWSGNAVTPFAASFQTGPGPDLTVGSVIRTSVQNAATGVPVNSVFVAEFSEPVDTTRFNTTGTTTCSGVYLYNYSTGTCTPSSVSFSPDALRMTLTPLANLSPSTQYQFYTGTGADLAGNTVNGDATNFTTSSATDTTPPTVVVISPPNGLVDVPRNAALNVLFSEPISATSLGGITVTVGGVNTPFSVGTASNYLLLTLNLSSVLPANTTVTVSVAGVRDIAGNQMVGTTTSTFTTGSQPDVTALATPTYTPAQGTANVPVNSAVQLLFNEPVNPARFYQSGANFLGAALELASNSVDVPVTYSFSADFRTVTLTPTAPLAANTQYRIRVGSSISTQNLAGLSMNQDFTSTFTTAP